MPHPSSTLSPNLDRRLSAWIDIQRRLQYDGASQPKPTITISRRFGCEGFPLAERLKAILDGQTREPWIIYDKALVERIATDEKLSVHLLERIGNGASETDAFGFLFPHTQSHEKLFEHMPKYIKSIARDGNAIIIGRGGAWITRDMTNCFHFRLEAPFAFRVQSMAERLELSAKDAEAFVRTNERLRERFIERHLGCKVDDPLLYDAVFNNARQSVERIAATIADMVLSDWKGRSQGVWPPHLREASANANMPV